MVNGQIESTKGMVRRSLQEYAATEREISNENVDASLSYLQRLDDHGQIRTHQKKRGAVGIRKKKDGSGYEEYTKQRTAEMVDNGQIETIPSGIGTKIANICASLTTSKTQSYQYVDEAGKPIQDEKALEALLSHRTAGGYGQALANADWVSCAVESGPIFTQFINHLRYTAFSPSCFYAKFQDEIVDDGKPRGTFYTDMDDALCVVIQTSATRGGNVTSIDKQQYVAIFGRSEDYQYGRYVTYTANRWQDIPDPGKEDSIDHVIDGELANPLSWRIEKGLTDSTVEYPVAILNGGLTVTTEELAPVTTSLYESSLEIDVALSSLLRYGLVSAQGILAFRDDLNHGLPRNMSGAMVLRLGQDAEILGQDVSNSTGALEIVKALAKSTAEGFNVPGYTVINSSGGNPESGISLMIQNQSLIDHRERRESINAKHINRIFEIEKGLHQVGTGEDLAPGIRQIWNAGRYILPEAPIEKTTRLKQALDDRSINYTRYIRDMNDLATDGDARKYIDRMREQDEEEDGKYAAPAPAQAARSVLPVGIGPRAPRV